MFLLELVMQGVREFRELVRLRFQRGFNLITAGNEGGKTTSIEAIQCLLFPDSRAQVIDALISRAVPDASRSALVVFPGEGDYYRVIQDFSRRAVNLSKYNAATKGFDLMNNSWESAAEFMAGLMNGLSEDDYARLFVLRRDPHHRQGASHDAAAYHAPSVAASAPRPAAGLTPAQEAKLAELREALRKADEAADADYRLESAKIRLGEITKKLENLEEFDGKASDIQANLAALKGCEQLPDDLAVLLDDHERSQSEKMARTDEIQQDIESLRIQFDGIPKAPIWKDALFLAGGALGGGSLLAGLFILSAEQSDYFLIGLLASMGLMSAAWYKSSRKNAQHNVLHKQITALEADLSEVEKTFEQGGSQIMAYMQATGSTTTAELRDKADNYRYFRSMLQDIEQQRRFALGGGSAEELLAERAKQQQEVIELEKAARAQSRHAVDTYSLRQEIERLELEASGGSGSWDFSAPGGFGDEPMTGSIAESGSIRTFLPELGIASRASGIEMETLIPAVEAAAQRNLAAVTAGKYIKVEAGQEGEPAVYGTDHQRIAFSSLSHGTQELLEFCLRVGLVEAVAGKLRVPVLIDDAIAGFDPQRQRAAAQILRSLGTKTQVLFFTSNAALREQGDAVVELK